MLRIVDLVVFFSWIWSIVIPRWALQVHVAKDSSILRDVRFVSLALTKRSAACGHENEMTRLNR